MQNNNSKLKVNSPEGEYQNFVRPSQPKRQLRRSRPFFVLRFEFGGGFTLIETIIALAVITSAVVGPFGLATRGILNSSFAKNKIIAANLSQEGIELVRKIRENNILAGRAWDYSITPGSWQIDIFSSDLSPFSGAPMLFDSATGIYSQASGSQTNFARKITVTKPSANEISISSEVSWIERSIDRKIILSEKLYNWR